VHKRPDPEEDGGEAEVVGTAIRRRNRIQRSSGDWGRGCGKVLGESPEEGGSKWLALFVENRPDGLNNTPSHHISNL